MQKNKHIFPDGWYTPPPHGIIALFADDTNIDRVNFQSVRPEKHWPRNDVFLNTKTGLLCLYASPVDKKSGVIGDFGLTLYFGDNQDIQTLLVKILDIDRQIFEFAKPGMKLSQISQYAENILHKNRMENQVVSRTDNAVVNIGHTIPVTYETWNQQEQEILKLGTTNWEETKDMISSKRKFVNDIEPLTIQSDFGVTIEPRAKLLDKPELPVSLYYHTIALFRENGEKELLTNFDELFSFIGMNYMIKH
jgi:hypothetical protein